MAKLIHSSSRTDGRCQAGAGWLTTLATLLLLVTHGQGQVVLTRLTSEICTLTPSRRPTDASCSDPDGQVDYMVIDVGFLGGLGTLRRVQFTNFSWVHVREQPFASLPELESISFTKVGTLGVSDGGLIFNSVAPIISIQIQSVDELKFDSNDADRMNSTTKIVINDIEKCKLSQNLFGTKYPGPSVEMRNIRWMDLGVETPPIVFMGVPLEIPLHPVFRGPIGHLLLANMTLSYCQLRFFSRNITRLEMVQVTMTDGRRVCATDTLSADALQIQSSMFGDVSSGSFAGDFGSVLINDSQFASVKQGGMSVTTGSFHLRGSSIESLDMGALDVDADKIHIEDTHVGVMRSGSLALMRVSSAQPLQITSLSTDVVENGSLVLNASGLAVIDAVRFSSCECPADAWVRSLVTSSGDDQQVLGKNEAYVSSQIQETGQCLTTEGDTVAISTFCFGLSPGLGPSEGPDGPARGSTVMRFHNP